MKSVSCLSILCLSKLQDEPVNHLRLWSVSNHWPSVWETNHYVTHNWLPLRRPFIPRYRGVYGMRNVLYTVVYCIILSVILKLVQMLVHLTYANSCRLYAYVHIKRKFTVFLLCTLILNLLIWRKISFQPTFCGSSWPCAISAYWGTPLKKKKPVLYTML